MSGPPAPDRAAGCVSGPLHAVGVGASAGGLEAMLAMFGRVRATGRLTFVVAQHMAQETHAELMVRLLGRHAALPVVVATPGQPLALDTIHVLPAGRDGRVRDGRLDLGPWGSESLSTPSVNALFTSLAEQWGPRAIGIILSGAGSDGRTGCARILAAGGMVLVQDPGEARFSGMPEAVRKARAATRVLKAERIGQVLMENFSAPEQAAPVATLTEASPTQLEELGRLLPLVRRETGVDFSRYKEDTLLRRLEKRKARLGLSGTGEYLDHVTRNPQELRLLQRHFLVSVSAFFRDRASFAALHRALGDFLSRHPQQQDLRIWVPGCASGEEAWSLAIAGSELLAGGGGRALRILGTDLNREALDLAGRGRYRPGAFREMEPDLLARYLIPRGPDFEVKPELRRVVEFAEADVLAGPPLDGLTLVSCRNLLIYLKQPLQDRLLASIHPALVPRGLLFLGQDESLGFASIPLYVPVDFRHRIFARRRGVGG